MGQRKGRTWIEFHYSSTVRVAVLVNRRFLCPVDDSGDESGSRFPPVVPFSVLSPTLSLRREGAAR